MYFDSKYARMCCLGSWIENYTDERLILGIDDKIMYGSFTSSSSFNNKYYTGFLCTSSFGMQFFLHNYLIPLAKNVFNWNFFNCYSSTFANQFQSPFVIPRGRGCKGTTEALCVYHTSTAML